MAPRVCATSLGTHTGVVRSLKNEMAPRGLTVRSGLKADLQHRLYSEIVRAAAEEAMGNHGYYNTFGSDSSDSSMDDDE